MSTHTHDLKKEVRGYLYVFGALLFFTIVTVAISYLHVHFTLAVTLALIVATIKATLVACFFMHLISEQKLIYLILFLAVSSIIGLVVLLIFEYHNVIIGTKVVA